jgi:hypothetical protein
MKIIEDECCDCGLPCIGNSCKYKNVERFYCDECKEEDTLYEYDGRELCIECIKKQLLIVKGSEIYC